MTKRPRDPRNGQEDHVARLERALAEALSRTEAAESQIEDQQQRLKALGQGREETMRALAEARDELGRVSRERDDLRRKLSRVDSVQVSTIALPEGDSSLSAAAPPVPSLDELMLALGQIEALRGEPTSVQQPQQERGNDYSEEMISPVLVFPEQYADTAKPAGEQDAAIPRVLVLLDAEKPVKYPLYKEVMTIGRADIADIQLDNGFLSRLHARIVTTAEGVIIEDAESKNGIRVNAKITTRQPLKHGDVVDLGRLRFRFIDMTADDAE